VLCFGLKRVFNLGLVSFAKELLHHPSIEILFLIHDHMNHFASKNNPPYLYTTLNSLSLSLSLSLIIDPDYQDRYQ
jgi:hypothetical protein